MDSRHSTRPTAQSSNTGKVLAMCACPYRIWTSRRTLAESAQVCSKCYQPYDDERHSWSTPLLFSPLRRECGMILWH
jgi:hypothetical protein